MRTWMALGLGLLTTACAAPQRPTLSQAQADAAVSRYAASRFRYEGTTQRDGQAGLVWLGLNPQPEGATALAGSVLLLTPDRRLLEALPVTAALRPDGCTVRFGDRADTLRIDGTCTPRLIAGAVTRAPVDRGQVALADLVGPAFSRDATGEAWLEAAR